MAETLKREASGGAPPAALGPGGPGPCSESTGNPAEAPASSAQTRIWLAEQLRPGTPAHHLPLVFDMTGPLDRPALVASLRDLVERHEALRTDFAITDGGLRQRVHPSTPVAPEFVDLADGGAPERGRLDDLIEARVRPAFDLTRAPLARMTLFRLAPDRHVLLVTLHHLVADGWSLGILHRELPVLYSARRAGGKAAIKPPGMTCREYAVRQRTCAPDTRAIEIWRRRLAGAPARSGLRPDHPPTAEIESTGKWVEAEAPAAIWSGFVECCRRERASPFMGLLAVLSILLYRHSGQEDLVIGVPAAGRDQPALEGVVGVFLNLLPMRCRVDGQATLRDLLQQLRTVALEAYSNQSVPFEQIVEALQPERSPGQTPLFQTVLNLVPPAFDPPTRWPDLVVRTSVRQGAQSLFDLNLYALPVEGALRLVLSCDASRFRRNRLEEFLRQFVHLLGELAAHADVPIRLPSLVTPHARALLPDPALPIDFPSDPGIHDGLAAAGQDASGSPVLSQGGRRWTRGQLDEAVDRLVSDLGPADASGRAVVAVTGPRSFGVIVAMLAVIRSGRILLTLDPNLPAARRGLMLEEARAGLLIRIGRSQVSTLDEREGRVSAWDIDADSAWRISTCGGASGSAQAAEADADAAYLFFTSGTTGRPKAVLGSRRGLDHFLRWQRAEFEIGCRDRAAQLTGLSCDVVLRDVLTPLLAGATLCLPVNGVDDAPDRVLGWLATERITLLHAVPSLAQAWLDATSPAVTLPELRLAFFAGEPLTDTLVRRWRRLAPTCRIINLYGPTETTLAKCFHEVLEEPVPGIQPIGRPLPQTQVLVLNAARQLSGIGEPGELVIRTPFRSHGYFHAPEETARQFLPNPWSRDPDDLVYLTGDLGYYGPEGLLEILGRNDSQVKIRGVRIEPDEIVAILSRHPDVQACAVVAREDSPGEKRLVAYVVPAAATPLPASTLADYLRRQLPPACVPSAFVQISRLPLTANGKLDRQALPAPPSPCPGERTDATRQLDPRNLTERRVMDMMAAVLAIPAVGPDGNFFDLGGDSLRAIQLVARLRRAFDVEIPLRLLFDQPTPISVAVAIEASLARNPAHTGRLRRSIVALQTEGSLPPLFIFPGGNGADRELYVHSYLARRWLGGSRPAYGFRMRGWDGGIPPHANLADMVRDYVAEIKRVQSDGPYHLLGDCTGGSLGFAIACHLQHAGDAIGTLILTDSVCPRPFEYLRFLAREYYRALRQFSLPFRSVSLVDGEFGDAGGPPRASLSPPRAAEHSIAPPVGGYWTPLGRHYRRVITALRPEKFRGRVHLLLSQGKRDQAMFFGWRAHVTDGIEVTELPANHWLYLWHHGDSIARILETAAGRK